jgi:hypothetical protein
VNGSFGTGGVQTGATLTVPKPTNGSVARHEPSILEMMTVELFCGGKTSPTYIIPPPNFVKEHDAGPP